MTDHKKSMATDDADLIDIEEAAELLNSTRPTVYRWVREGKLPGVKVGRQWRLRRADIERYIQGLAPMVNLPADISPLIRDLQKQIVAAGGDDAVPTEMSAEAAVRLMIRLAVLRGATGLHVTTHRESGTGEVYTVLRYRIDGQLHECCRIDVRLNAALIAEWKRVFGCNPQESGRPQDGRSMVSVSGADSQERMVDLRGSFLPAQLGESVTARILNSDAVLISLDRLPFSETDGARLREALRAPFGLIVVTGPTGSGKTTTLYACVNELATAAKKVVSIEDPVEYLLPWVTQMSVKPTEGVTFSSALRAVMRSDVDVLMVGEIRDLETLMCTLQASLAGTLAVTSMHTEDATGALIRMRDVGASVSLIADATSVVVGQRLVRVLCTACKESYAPAPDTLQVVAQLAEAGGLDWQAISPTFCRATGCPACAQTGYRGRVPLNETLRMSSAIRRLVVGGGTADEIRDTAIAEGMTSLTADGLRRASTGQTSLHEVARILNLDTLRCTLSD